MKHRLIVIQFLISLVATLSFGASEMAFHVAGSDEIVTVPVVDTKNGAKLVAVALLCEKAGYTCTWDPLAERFTCSKKGSVMVFKLDNQFYTVNGVVCQLAVAPRRIGPTLYLSLTSITTEIKHFANGTISADTTANIKPVVKATDKVNEKTAEKVVSGSSRYTVSSVSIDKKQNGTLFTLALADSLPFEYTYFYPNLTINFLGGTVDTQTIRQLTRIGLVDSVFALQYKKSAQVSVILNREIEDPLIDYIQDTKTLLIALRQKKIRPNKAAMAKKVETGAVITEAVPLAGISDDALKTIVIDPGHGGKDPGAVGVSGIMEKDVVLAIACKVRDLLRKQTKLKVLLTRDKDVFIPLADRTKFANDKKADFFLSIHADAVPGTNKRKEITRGYKIYFLSQAKNEDDKLVAMRENAVIELEEKPQDYSNLQNVLIDLAGNEFLKESQELCILIDQKFEKTIGSKIGKLHLGVGQANFWVLNGAYMPSVLVEAGFLSNAKEEKLLSSKNIQNQIAQSVCDAIIGLREKYENGI